MTHSVLARRAFLGAALTLPLGACTTSGLFGSTPKPRYTLSPQGDRMVWWLQTAGVDNMMAPEALALMGITNEGRDIPVRQLAREDETGRYVVSLVNIRKVHELVFHRRQGDVLILHLSDTKFERMASVRYPRTGKPTLITDRAFAESDFRQQVAFWFRAMPPR
ncbi:hypothetical protein [Reyranella sp.]|uniref:hypothetical protein n=1 Tax=Reyranella sp. TaxID=1929291 RepID=UPI003BA985F7